MDLTAKAFAAVLEVNPNTVYRWDTRAREAGEAALMVQKRRRRKGEKQRLRVV
jgi:transposase